MPFASVSDVAVPLLRPLTSAEEEYAARLLGWAELLIKARYPDLSVLDRDAVIMVEAQAVARVLRNPEGKIQESLAGEYQSTRNALGADGQLRISDEEWELLSPTGPGKRQAFTVDTAPRLVRHAPLCGWHFASNCTCGLS